MCTQNCFLFPLNNYVIRHQQKPAFFAFVLTAFLFVCLLCPCMAQRTVQDDLRSRTMECLNEEEAARLLAFLKAQRPEDNFCFQFQLKHKPRRGRTARYEGVVYGFCNEEGPISRFHLFPNEMGDKSLR